MEKTKVIIDCDPGIDDSLAIMLALKSPEIEVIGITIVCGNSPVEMGAGNAKKVLKQMNRLDVPVYIGESKPLKREYVNALDTHGEDGLGESFLPEVEGWQQEMGAVHFEKRKGFCDRVGTYDEFRYTDPERQRGIRPHRETGIHGRYV